MNSLKIFSGNSNRPLAEAVCEDLGIKLGSAKIKTFEDGETNVEIDESVRGLDVFAFQSTCCPANHHLMELLVTIDALKRASAGRITAVLPYYGYARQDRKVAPRAPITAKLVADMIAAAGAHRVLTVELHAGQIQGFFDIPVDHLFARSVLIEPLKKINSSRGLVVVSPDAGGVERARAFAKRLHAGLAIVDKRRSAPNQAKAMAIIGDVEGKTAIILDDMVDTAGTLTEAAGVIEDKGAKAVHACCTHAVLSGPAVERINNSSLESLLVTDTIPLSDAALNCEKIIQVSISKLVSEAILRSYRGDSVNSLFV